MQVAYKEDWVVSLWDKGNNERELEPRPSLAETLTPHFVLLTWTPDQIIRT